MIDPTYKKASIWIELSSKTTKLIVLKLTFLKITQIIPNVMLQAIIITLGVPCGALLQPLAHAEDLIQSCDWDGDGQLNFDEFCMLMMERD